MLPRELAFGVLRVADSPVAAHQRAVGDLLLALTPFVRERALGEVLPAPIHVILDFDAALVVQPDLLFVSQGRQHIVTDRVYGAPDLVIAVLSPRPRVGQLEERVGWFARYSVRECWLVNVPMQQIAVLTFESGRVTARMVVAGTEPVRSQVRRRSRLRQRTSSATEPRDCGRGPLHQRRQSAAAPTVPASGRGCTASVPAAGRNGQAAGAICAAVPQENTMAS